MNLSDLKDPVVVSEPKNLSDLKDPKLVDEGPKIGLSGPGSKDPSPSDVVSTDPYQRGDVDLTKSSDSQATRNTKDPKDAFIGTPSEEARGFINFAGTGALGELAGPLIGAAAKKAAPYVESIGKSADKRIVKRAIDAITEGAPQGVRERVTGDGVNDIVASEKGLQKKAKNIYDAQDEVTKLLDKRSALLDAKYKASEDRFVADYAAPTHVNEPATSQIKSEPMSKMVGSQRSLPEIERPQIEGNVQAQIGDDLNSTQRIPREPMRQLTGDVPESNPVIDMKRNGSLEPSSVKESISKVADKLERTDASKADAARGLLTKLEREISAETKSTHADPNLRWWRQKATDLQKVANKHAMTADETAIQAAHGEVADAIRSALENHMQDPELAKLNGEVSSLMRLKGAIDAKIIKQEAPGGSPGKFGKRMHRIVGGAVDSTAAIAALATGNPLPLIVPAVIHGAPVAFSSADKALSFIAGAARAGKDVPKETIDAALKAGVKASTIGMIFGGPNDR